MTEGERGGNGSLYRYRFGSAEFDEARFELRIGGLPVELERRPLEVLRMLLQCAGEIVTKEELFETVWAGRITVENVLANAVAKLRKALGEANAGLIVTQARIGYRLDARVERVAVGRRMVSGLSLQPGEAVPGRANFILVRQFAGSAGGEAWLARHDKTGAQRVYKFCADGARLSALKREATLSRVLRDGLGERDDIAWVIDWNFEAPPFYLECAYGGPALPAWAEEDGRLAALPDEDRRALALQLIDAVGAAHSVGVLHKDLKPANVLVDRNQSGAWQVRLTDFGSGALVEPGRLEELGVTALGFTLPLDALKEASLGTPLYIAPELLSGAAPTVRSDVYALGVLLYQIMAGDLKKPLTTGWQDDIADPLLCEDIAEATAGDPARRIASAEELGSRLRHLEDRRAERARLTEAEARARTAQAALVRARARRPWAIAAGAVLLAGTIISTTLFVAAHQARETAERQAARAEATAAFLRDIMLNADPREPGAGREATLREALSRATGRIEARFAGDPAMEATIRITAGDIYAGLQDYQTALLHRRRAATLFQTMLGPVHPRTLEARYHLAEALTNASLFAEAADMLDAADADAGPLLARNDALALIAAQARGRHYLLQAKIEPAMAQYEEALRRLARAAPEDARTLFALNLDLAQGYVRTGRQDEAVELLEVLQDEARFADAGVSDARRATARLHYGAALLYSGRLAEAEPVLIDAVRAIDEAFGDQSSHASEARGTLSNLYATSGRLRDALPLISSVREAACAAHGPDHQLCLMSTGNEGVLLVQLGESEAALGKIVLARDAFARLMGESSVGVQVMNYYLAQALLDLGDGAEAARLAAGLDPDMLAAGSPGKGWPLRVSAIQGWAQILTGERAQGIARLQAAVSDMEALGLQDWILDPFRKALADGPPELTVAAGGPASDP